MAEWKECSESWRWRTENECDIATSIRESPVPSLPSTRRGYMEFADRDGLENYELPHLRRGGYERLLRTGNEIVFTRRNADISSGTLERDSAVHRITSFSRNSNQTPRFSRNINSRLSTHYIARPTPIYPNQLISRVCNRECECYIQKGSRVCTTGRPDNYGPSISGAYSNERLLENVRPYLSEVRQVPNTYESRNRGWTSGATFYPSQNYQYLQASDIARSLPQIEYPPKASEVYWQPNRTCTINEWQTVAPVYTRPSQYLPASDVVSYLPMIEYPESLMHESESREVALTSGNGDWPSEIHILTRFSPYLPASPATGYLTQVDYSPTTREVNWESLCPCMRGEWPVGPTTYPRTPSQYLPTFDIASSPSLVRYSANEIYQPPPETSRPSSTLRIVRNNIVDKYNSAKQWLTQLNFLRSDGVNREDPEEIHSMSDSSTARILVDVPPLRQQRDTSQPSTSSRSYSSTARLLADSSPLKQQQRPSYPPTSYRSYSSTAHLLANSSPLRQQQGPSQSSTAFHPEPQTTPSAKFPENLRIHMLDKIKDWISNLTFLRPDHENRADPEKKNLMSDSSTARLLVNTSPLQQGPNQSSTSSRPYTSTARLLADIPSLRQPQGPIHPSISSRPESQNNYRRPWVKLLQNFRTPSREDERYLLDKEKPTKQSRETIRKRQFNIRRQLRAFREAELQNGSSSS